jgi:hypothetical protein
MKHEPIRARRKVCRESEFTPPALQRAILLLFDIGTSMIFPEHVCNCCCIKQDVAIYDAC